MDREELFKMKPLIKIHDKVFPCLTSAAMEFIGGKWKSAILTHLINGNKRYSQLKKDLPTITERTLSLQLKQLEKDGLINRRSYNIKPPLKVEYDLTEFGRTLIPTLNAIVEWGVIAAEKHGEFILKE